MTTPYGNITHSPFSSSSSVSQSFSVAHVSSSGQLPTVAQYGSPAKESVVYNPASLCRKGQETIQEILLKTTEVFQYLRTMQMPNGVNVSVQQFQDRKHKLDEPVRQLEILFRKLRFIYDSVNESTANLASQPVEPLLSYVDTDTAEQENKKDDKQQYSTDEEQELVQQLQMKNRQLKEIIDQLRTIIWEINTMMTMRRTASQ